MRLIIKKLDDGLWHVFALIALDATTDYYSTVMTFSNFSDVLVFLNVGLRYVRL